MHTIREAERILNKIREKSVDDEYLEEDNGDKDAEQDAKFLEIGLVVILSVIAVALVVALKIS